MSDSNKKAYFTANLGTRNFALHCSQSSALLLKRELENIIPCSKAEYRSAREGGASSYADAMDILWHNAYA